MRRLRTPLTHALIWLLCGILSGTGPALASVFTAKGTTSSELNDHLQTLLRRTFYAGTPGTPSGVASVEDLRGAQQKLLLEKQVAEHEFSSTENILLVNQYFKTLTSLTLLEIALQQPLSAIQPSPNEFEFHVPKDIQHRLPRLHHLTFGATEDLRLKASFIEQLRTSSATTNVSEENFFKLMRRLATRQLLQNLGDLHYLKSDRSLQIPAESNELFQEQQKSLSQKKMVEALLAHSKELDAQLPDYFHPKLIKQLSKLSAVSEKELTALLKEANPDSFSDALRIGLQTLLFENDSLPLSALRQLVLSTQRTLAFEQLFTLAEAGGPLDDLARIKAATELLDLRSKDFEIEVTDGSLQTWFEKAKKTRDESLYQQRRVAFIDNLISESWEIANPTPVTKLSPTLLVRALTAEIAKLDPSREVRSAVFQISQQSNLAEASKIYEQWMNRFSDTTPLDLNSPISISPELTAHLNQRAARNRQQHAAQLRQIGNWLGFTGNAPQYDTASYSDAFKKQILRTHPILSMSVTTQEGNVEPLHQVLSSPRVTSFEEAVPWVDQGLTKIEANIVTSLEQIQNTQALHELEQIVTSSLMLQLVLNDFPEFRVHREHFIENLLTPTIPGQLMRNYVGPYMGAGIILLLLAGLKKTKRAGVYATALEMGLGPFLDSYIHSILAVMLADYVYQVDEFLEVRKNRQQAELLFFSGATETTFLDYTEKTNADGTYTAAQRQLLIRVAIDTSLGMFFSLRSVFKRASVKGVPNDE